MAPSVPTETVPPLLPWVTPVTVSVSFSSGANESLARTLMMLAVLSSTTVAVSFPAIGLSLDSVRLTVTVAVSVPPLPSLTV